MVGGRGKGESVVVGTIKLYIRTYRAVHPSPSAFLARSNTRRAESNEAMADFVRRLSRTTIDITGGLVESVTDITVSATSAIGGAAQRLSSFGGSYEEEPVDPGLMSPPKAPPPAPPPAGQPWSPAPSKAGFISHASTPANKKPFISHASAFPMAAPEPPVVVESTTSTPPVVISSPPSLVDSPVVVRREAVDEEPAVEVPLPPPPPPPPISGTKPDEVDQPSWLTEADEELKRPKPVIEARKPTARMSAAPVMVSSASRPAVAPEPPPTSTTSSLPPLPPRRTSKALPQGAPEPPPEALSPPPRASSSTSTSASKPFVTPESACVASGALIGQYFVCAKGMMAQLEVAIEKCVPK